MTAITYRIEHHPPLEGDLSLPIETYYVAVDTGVGTTVMVEVVHNLIRDSYEVEWSRELFDQCPEALVATVQLVMLAIQVERGSWHGPSVVARSNG